MGVSTDAKLFYGFCVDEDSETHSKIEDYDDDHDEDDKSQEGSLGWLHYMGKSDCGVTVGYHCSDECTMYYIAIEASEARAHRGYPKQVTAIEAKSDWDKRLKAFCDHHKIEPGKIGWWLVSYWG